MRRRPGGKPAARGCRPQPPQARRPEAQHDELAFGDQHPVGLAQHRVRIGRQLEGVRQQHGIDRGIIDRQVRQTGHQVAAGARLGRVRDHALAADARGRQQLAPGSPGAELQQLQAKHIVKGRGQQLGLSLDQRTAELPALPLVQYGITNPS